MERIELPGGWYLEAQWMTADMPGHCETYIDGYSLCHPSGQLSTGFLIPELATSLAAAINAPRPEEQALRDEVERLRAALIGARGTLNYLFKQAGAGHAGFAQVAKMNAGAAVKKADAALAASERKDAQTEGANNA